MNRQSISGISNASEGPPCIGRFAPSPSGPLHFGSLVAAVGSYLDARTRGGRWLVRMEDLDTPRNVAGADRDILATLERFGFEWDGEILVQSRRQDRYRAVLEDLKRAGTVFPCACTRKEIADSLTAPHLPGAETRYPGNCRAGLPPGRSPRAWRFRVPAGEVVFEDRLQGRIAQDVAGAIGDFVLLRADGIFAYQLAVVVDDADQGMTDIVRGADLLDSTPRQLLLQRALGLPEPRYAHLPVAANAAGEKLSKQTKARSLEGLRPEAALARALVFLGQAPPPEGANLGETWAWAIARWRMDQIPRQRALPAPER